LPDRNYEKRKFPEWNALKKERREGGENLSNIDSSRTGDARAAVQIKRNLRDYS